MGRLVPRGLAGRTRSGKRADPSGGFLDRAGPLSKALGRDVVDCEYPSRGARLAEALVVLVQIVDEVACRPYVDATFSWPCCRLALRPRDRDDGRQR